MTVTGSIGKVIRIVRWRRTPRGSYIPTVGERFSFVAPVDTRTGQIIEPDPAGGFRVAEHAAPHDPEAVLLFFRRELERDAERRAARERAALGIVGGEDVS